MKNSTIKSTDLVKEMDLRTYVAIEMMAALISTGENIESGEMACIAVSYADEVINALNDIDLIPIKKPLT